MRFHDSGKDEAVAGMIPLVATTTNRSIHPQSLSSSMLDSRAWLPRLLTFIFPTEDLGGIEIHHMS